MWHLMFAAPDKPSHYWDDPTCVREPGGPRLARGCRFGPAPRTFRLAPRRDKVPRFMRGERTFLVVLVWAASTACIGCAATRNAAHTDPAIRDMLRVQTEAWNRGDVRSFMRPYWNSPDLTFSSGGKTTRGWQATLDRYLTKYPTRDQMGSLSFSDVEVREVGSRAALVLGRWHLERGQPIGGNFSLVLRREEDEWVIIHDHTSVDAP